MYNPYDGVSPMSLIARCCSAAVLVLIVGPIAAIAAPHGAAARAPTAELEKAKAHYAQGKVFFEQGNLQLARAEFEESYRLSKRADLLFNLALVAEKLGVYREAADYLVEYLRQRPGAPDRKSIQKSIDELERRAEVQRKAEVAAAPPAQVAEPTPAPVAP